MGFFLVLVFLLTAQPALTCARAPCKASPSDPTLVGDPDSPPVVSSDGRWQVRAKRSANERWLWLEHRNIEGGVQLAPIQLAPLERFGYVLWSPDSGRIAFTDAEFTNHWVVRVANVDRVLNPFEIEDANPLFEERFLKLAGDKYMHFFLPKAISWLSEKELLIAVSGQAADMKKPGGAPIEKYLRGYVIDVEKQEVIREIDATTLRKQYHVERTGP